MRNLRQATTSIGPHVVTQVVMEEWGKIMLALYRKEYDAYAERMIQILDSLIIDDEPDSGSAQVRSDYGTTARRFVVLREVDIHGTSGTGIICDGVLWEDGTCTIRWRGERPSIVHWQNLNDAEWVHSHGGNSDQMCIQFIDIGLEPEALKDCE